GRVTSVDGGAVALSRRLGERYCSESCYELGGATVTRELLSGWAGNCSVCRGPMKLALGGVASVVCYRPGEFLYFCGSSSCVELVRHAVAEQTTCVVCGEALTSTS